MMKEGPWQDRRMIVYWGGVKTPAERLLVLIQTFPGR